MSGKNISVWVGMLIAIGGGTAFAASTDCKNVDQYKEIDKKELTDLVKSKKVFVVDVNSRESYDKNHIPTAIHYGDFKNDDAFAAALPKDPNATIVAYCGGLQCAAWQQAAVAACNHQHTSIRHFKPGITGWMAGKQTFFDSKERTASAAPTTPSGPSTTSTQ